MDSAFWEAVWDGPFTGKDGKRQRAGPGGTHPSSPRLDQHGTVAVPNRKLITQLRAVQHALAQGVLDPTKVMVVPHENRTDTWFLRFTNLESDEWRGGEIVAWIVFDYVPDRGKGTSKPLATFPDKPPLFGVLTPTGVFTPQTGAKWVCLPGLAQGFGNEELVWQTVYSGQLPGSHPRYNFDLVAGGHAVRVTSANPKNVHFKGGSALPVLDGSMVNYVRVLLDQFDSPGGWYKLATIGADEHVDGMHDRSVLAANVANGTTGAMLRDAARWNEEHLGPLMEKFREADASLQGAAPPPPPPPAPPLPAGTGPPLEGGGGGGGAEGLPPGSGSESAVIKREIEEAVQQIRNGSQARGQAGGQLTTERCRDLPPVSQEGASGS